MAKLEASENPKQISAQEISLLVNKALQEDIGTGDVSAKLIPEYKQATAKVISRASAVLCGQQFLEEVFKQLDGSTGIEWVKQDGDEISSGDTICTITGNAQVLLTGERAALNLLQTLSATATETSKFVQAVEQEKIVDSTVVAKILDTRKTIPGLRIAQKYAVVCGGGVNHRFGLYDAFLIKENHIAACGSIGEAVMAAKKVNSNLLLEVEVESLGQLQEALSSGVERILLDNFSYDMLEEAVAINKRTNNGKQMLEASGNISLDNIVRVAKTGVDYISIGSLTKNITAIDLSMLFEKET